MELIVLFGIVALVAAMLVVWSVDRKSVARAPVRVRRSQIIRRRY